MDSLKLLLVSFCEKWQTSLTQSLHSLGYAFEIDQVATKKQALVACTQSRYDLLITRDQLPDGASGDLVQGLGSTMACLIIRESSRPATATPDTRYTETSFLSLSQPKAWAGALKEALSRWEKGMSEKIMQGLHDRRLLYDKAAARCAAELYHESENRIENALEVLLDILQVSRMYVRDVPVYKRHSAMVIHEISSPGQQPVPGACSVYEVPVRHSRGQIRYLGMEDALPQRIWNPAEMDLLKTVASLLRGNREDIRHKIAMYRELGMTA